MENEGWVAAMRVRDPARIAELRTLLAASITASLGVRVGVGHADIEDFAQEAVLRVVERIDQFRGDSRFTTWAIAVAIRVALTHVRRRKGTSLEATAEEPVSFDDPTRTAQRDELLERLSIAIDRDLTERQREAVRLFLSGTPQVVLAERIGLSAGAFHKMMHDARMRLRKSLEAAGYEPEGVLGLIGD